MESHDGAAPQSILRLRFPDGEVEIRWTAIELPVGVLVRSRGTLWVVKSSNGHSVTLEAAPTDTQAPLGAPAPKPDAITEDVFLEMIAV
jgi:hypothetical protein